jgi:hypothetical protein
MSQPYVEPFHARARRLFNEIERLREECQGPWGQDQLTFEALARQYIERELRDAAQQPPRQ